MLILKYLNGDFNPVEQKCDSIKEAIDFDYRIWAALGENCSFYYKNKKLKLDTINCTKEEVEKDIKDQMIEIDKVTKRFVCIAKCPELDCDNLGHCIDTEEGIQEKNYSGRDYCPCGNHEIWQELKEN